MDRKVSLLDGSLATQIAVHVGKNPDGDPLWTARFITTDPNAVYATHLDFLRAGSNIIETVTYQASIGGFKEHLGLNDKQSLDLIRKAVELAKKAIETYKEECNDKKSVNREILVAGSCGPYGATLHDGSEYTGAYCEKVSKEFLMSWHRPRIEALLNAGVDLLAIETIPCEKEAAALVDLLKEYPHAKAWLSFSCSKDGINLANGTKFQEVALQCYQKSLPGQIIAIGVNCLSPKIVTSLLKGINKDNHVTIPLVVYPNSGEVYSSEEGWIKDNGESITPADFVHEWLDLGVRYIGGCCRTKAEDVVKIRKQIELWQSQERESLL
ncbi:homocysteine S-methyltransferase-like [Venturia canescens]|uniref:homocysteine S-methyltransferase-like n=1 Tax=Venturia canescens TaxID=32260 RepID=UPI001C9D2709|nr:homocysteine S-methyltransferase-like [Venturia canescens]